jgi:chitosanase
MYFFIRYLLVLITLVGCGNKTSSTAVETATKSPSSNKTNLVKIGFSKEQRIIADQIISVFENDTPKIQYGYAENLYDGRGITAGRAGFTSATADMLEVIERYTALTPDNSLAIYLPRLRVLAKNESGSTKGLEGLERKWKVAANNKAFNAVQDEVVDDYYYNAAVRHAESLGTVLPLTLLNLYDAVIQHGDGEDPDGLSAIIDRTATESGGSPKTGIDEKIWLRTFISVRRTILISPYNRETQEEWSESVGRVDELIKLYNKQHFSLTPPIVVAPWGASYILN